MSKNSFVLYDEEYEYLKLLSYEERGKLITAIYEYRLQGNTDIKLSESATMLFHFIKNHIDRDSKKYADVCVTRKACGSQGGRPRKNQNNQRKPNGFETTEGNQMVFKKPDNDNDNDNDNNITTITTITPPTPSSEGKEGKRKIKVSEIDSAEKEFNLDAYLGSDEHDLFVAVCDRMREQCVKETSVMYDPPYFLAFKEARDWNGPGGEDVIANLTKYVARWVREKAKKEDAG